MTGVPTTVVLDRVLVLDLVTLLRALEAAAPPTVRARAVSVEPRYLSHSTYLVRETVRLRQQVEDQLIGG